jgi:hypothetical protein
MTLRLHTNLSNPVPIANVAPVVRKELPGEDGRGGCSVMRGAVRQRRRRAVAARPEQESDQARSGLPLGPLAPLAGGWNPAGRASISAPRPPHRFVWRSGVLDAAAARSAGRATWCHIAFCRFRRVKQQTHEPAARVLPASMVEAVGPTLGRSADLGGLVMSQGPRVSGGSRVRPDRLHRLASTRLALAAVARR